MSAFEYPRSFTAATLASARRDVEAAREELAAHQGLDRNGFTYRARGLLVRALETLDRAEKQLAETEDGR